MVMERHRGAQAGGLFSSEPNRVEQEIIAALDNLESGATLPNYGLSRDSSRTALAAHQSFPTVIDFGTVVHALPGVHWYRVQTAQTVGWMPACYLSETSLTPIGPRDCTPLAPGASVLLIRPVGLPYAFIVGVIPPNLLEDVLTCPDWLVQGGGSGFRREDGHMFVLTGLGEGGGVADWSAGRPIDGTAAEWARMSMTGIGLLIDDWQTYLRVNEMCGLFLSYFDSHTRLAGVQLDIESAVHGENARDDEGESYFFRGVAVYPWEALGLYANGTPFTKENDDKEVQFSAYTGKIDLQDDDLQSFYRYVEYGGYLGQGYLRAVSAPGTESGSRHYKDDSPDYGLFCENIGLDGSYALRSAKRLYFGKRSKIVVPKQLLVPEDPTGDDAKEDNYKFSSKFGSGDEHKIVDVKIDGDAKCMLRAAGVQDLIAYVVNWQALHPFHYHENDYKTFQESDLTKPSKVQEQLDFGQLDTGFMDDPTATKIHVDHRYGDVDYFERESFLMFHDDGSVQIGCGYGSGILLAGGDIRLQAPGKIVQEAGTDVVVLADQIEMRANHAIDQSVSDGDFRIKSEKNMQFLSGNGGQGGMLFESKGEGTQQQYTGNIGEDVVATGIVFRASNGIAAILAQDIYLRTGGDNLGDGQIVLDSGQGKGRCQIYAEALNVYLLDAVTFAYGPQGTNSNVNQVYYFSTQHCIVDCQMLLGGSLYGYNNASVIVEGGVDAAGTIAAGGQLASKSGGFVGKSGDLGKSITDALNSLTKTIKSVKTAMEELHKDTIVQSYYQQDQVGSEDTIRDMHFSFRDDPNADQYHVKKLLWPEPRWQMLARLGLGSGGQTWDEKSVSYQGEETFPYPGRKKWQDEPIFLQLQELTMFDVDSGDSKDRPDPYEKPKLSDWDKVAMADEYKLNR